MQVRVIDAILVSVSETSNFLRQGDSSGQVGSTNRFGDHQLKVLPSPRAGSNLLIQNLTLHHEVAARCGIVRCLSSTCLLIAD